MRKGWAAGCLCYAGRNCARSELAAALASLSLEGKEKSPGVFNSPTGEPGSRPCETGLMDNALSSIPVGFARAA